MKDIEELEQREREHIERRDFLAAAGRVAAVFGVLGLTAESASAQQTDAEQAKLRLMVRAIRTGDPAGAVATYGDAAGLTVEQRRTITSLPSGDFAKVRSIGGRMGHTLGFAVPDWAPRGPAAPAPAPAPTESDEPIETPSSGGGGKKIGIIIF